MTKKLLYFLIYTIFLSCNQKYDIKESKNLITRLKEGNKRFYTNKPLYNKIKFKFFNDSNFKEKEPNFMIVSCSDCKIPPDVIFDQNIGNIFSIRTVGNIVNDYELGSLEYAIKNYDCSMLIVLGHTKCKALTLFQTNEHNHINENVHFFDHIDTIIKYFSSEKKDNINFSDKVTSLDSLVRYNINYSIDILKYKDEVIKELFKHKVIKILGAIYNEDTGEVEFINN